MFSIGFDGKSVGLLPVPGPRKEAILALTPRCDVAAEIGADHGITSAHMLQRGIAGRMIVSDISAASLKKARRLFALHGLEDRAAFRVADGLRALEAPVQAVVIAGMGSQTIARILQNADGAVKDAALILQPNPDPPFLRRWLHAHGYCLDAERLVREGGRFYVVMRARRGTAECSEKECLLGPCLLRDKPALWREYLLWRRGCLLAARGDDAREAIGWIEEELAL